MAGRAVEPGVTTAEIDHVAYQYILSQGAKPSQLGYSGFPATCCISVNHEVIHGIPAKKTVIKEGDVVSIDLGAQFEGYNGDNAATFAAGHISPAAERLMTTTREALYEGIRAARSGGRVGDISAAVQCYVEARGFSVVRKFVGHGVGVSLHEAPEVPNFGTAGRGMRLVDGMTLAIEPMVNAGGPDVKVLGDGWTVVTTDGSLSAHFEHTIAITADGPEILTVVQGV